MDLQFRTFNGPEGLQQMILDAHRQHVARMACRVCGANSAINYCSKEAGCMAPHLGQTFATLLTQCHRAIYCSVECQAADWDSHKPECKWQRRAHKTVSMPLTDLSDPLKRDAGIITVEMQKCIYDTRGLRVEARIKSHTGVTDPNLRRIFNDSVQGGVFDVVSTELEERVCGWKEICLIENKTAFSLEGLVKHGLVRWEDLDELADYICMDTGRRASQGFYTSIPIVELLW